jgi:hypothetical protein
MPANPTKLLLDSLQLLLLALAAATQLLVLLSERRKATNAATVLKSIPRNNPDEDLLDLSFLLLFASLVSFLLTHSLLISGRIVSLGIGLVFEATAIVLFVGTLLYFAYRGGKANMAIGILSAATLLILLSSPGGPFRELQQGAEAGLDLLWPTLVLLTIASASLFHEFGGPFTRGTPSWERILAICGTVGIAIIASLALGMQSEVSIDQDTSIPKLSDAARSLLAAIRKPSVQPETRKMIYQMLSDHALAGYYEGQFEKAQAEFLDVDKQRSNPSRIANETIARAHLLDDQRKDFVDSLTEAFGHLSLINETAYLQARLGFVHPLGELNSRRAPTSVPGRTVIERFKQTSQFRQVYGIERNGVAVLSEDTSNGISYDASVRSHFIINLQADGKQTLVSKLTGYSPMLFPSITGLSFQSTLEKQLLLPVKEESFVAYSEYHRLADEYIRQHLPSGRNGADVQALSESLSALPNAVKHAYLYYQRVNQRLGNKESDLVDMMLEFSDLDFSPVQSDTNLLDVLFLPAAPANPDLAQLYTNFSQKSSKAKEVFKALASHRAFDIRLDSLFDRSFLAVMRQIVDQSDKGISVAQYMASPVALGLEHLLENARIDDSVKEVVRKSWNLDEQELESVLFYLSLSLHEGGGQFAPGLFQMLILEAGLMGDAVKVLVVLVLYIPVLLVCVVAGDFAARKLAAREMLHRMMKSETEGALQVSTSAAKAVDLIGRDAVSQLILKLAKRGWSTIALAGRRGVGKSRLLQKLQVSYREAGSIAVWMFAPSHYAESDFVEDVFERLATSTEATIGRAVRAKPLLVRDLEQRSSRLGAGVFVATLVAFYVLVDSMSERLLRPELSMSWIPAGALLIASFCVLILHFRKLQPMDLTSWIERERKIDSHLVWLYRETVEALRFVAARRGLGRPGIEMWRDRSSPWLAFLFGGLSFTCFAFAIADLFDDTNYDAWTVIIFLIFGLAFLIALVAIFSRRRSLPRDSEIGASIVVLVERYRRYAETVVRRLKHGALGSPKDLSPIVVCIDELDKIVDFEELRQFIRRVKSIFEIPGVSYYLSISEDALTALNLGASLGKNEVDSSFDHIVMVPPLELDDAALLASEYATFLGVDALPSRVARMVAAMSFGIPRDIVRRCDELADVLGSTTPEQVAQHWLNVMLDLGEASGFLSSSAVAELRLRSSSRIDFLVQELDRVAPEDSGCMRHLLLIGTLVLLSDAALATNEAWNKATLDLSAFGYGLPTRRIADLRADFNSFVQQRAGSSPLGAP